MAGFNFSLNILSLKIDYWYAQLEGIIQEIIKRNTESDYFVKVLAYPISSNISIELKSELFIIPTQMEPDNSFDYEKGIKIITKEYQRFLPEAKSTNYLPLVYWRKEIIEAEAVDVLYYSNNSIRETSRGNVFMVKNGEVFTPHNKILKGISRSIVIDILNQEKIPLFE